MFNDGGVEPVPNVFLGYSPKIQMQRTVDGEITQEEIEDFLEEIRMVMGEVGRVNPQVGRSFSWNSLSFQNTMEGNGRLMHVMVTPRDGKTRIRITESSGYYPAMVTGISIFAAVVGTGIFFDGGVSWMSGLFGLGHS